MFNLIKILFLTCLVTGSMYGDLREKTPSSIHISSSQDSTWHINCTAKNGYNQLHPVTYINGKKFGISEILNNRLCTNKLAFSEKITIQPKS